RPHRALRRPGLSPRRRPAGGGRARGGRASGCPGMIKKAVLILVLALVALPATWRFVLRFLASGKMPASTQESEEALPESDPVAVVCSGYAALGGGITSLYPSQSGRVAEVLVRENDKVAANAVLLRLDDRTARCRVAEARGVLDKALAQLAKVANAPE